ncbi:MAG: helicase-related protein [Candidatus Sumerlaeaceae bacterium]
MAATVKQMEEARREVVSRITKLLLGPLYGDTEVINSSPANTYLTGILHPPAVWMDAEEEAERLAQDDDLEGTGDEPDEPAPEKSAPLYMTSKPASIGLTCTLSNANADFIVVLRYARYIPDPPVAAGEDEDPGGDPDTTRIMRKWKRVPVEHRVLVQGSETRSQWRETALNTTEGQLLEGVHLDIRRRVVRGALMVTATLINTTPKMNSRSEACLFQTEVGILAKGNISPRPIECRSNEEDLLMNQLLYRNAREFAVGHGVAAHWVTDNSNSVDEVWTRWLPNQYVSATTPEGHSSLQELKAMRPSVFDAAMLATSQRDVIVGELSRFCKAYDSWIDTEDFRKDNDLTPSELATAVRHIRGCRSAKSRMQAGVELLMRSDRAFRAFQLANAAMDSQSNSVARGPRARPLVWRPFQLAFILLALPGVADPKHQDRDLLDLLWFPTGGGKTEAYLGLSAFAIFHDRLCHNASFADGGVKVLMRYTLRLLTIQQFQRAAAMICEAELIRQRCEEEIGTAPISLGLYVGQGATPNKVSERDNVGKLYEGCAQEILEREARGEQPETTPRMLDSCPLCGSSLGISNYGVIEETNQLKITCHNASCRSSAAALPVYTVDDEIYRVLPSLILGTVDKFAQLPRNSKVGGLLGRPQNPLCLIIQDELHLISGPLGSMTGLYEAGLDFLAERAGEKVKIVGSTATIGHASDQVRALFNRDVCQFPPPSIDAGESFFAVTDVNSPNRWYIGISSAGRSPKFTLQAVTAALLQVVYSLQEESAWGSETNAVLDPFWTAVLYFNSMRELGGARVMVQDDVRRSTLLYARLLSNSERHRDPGEPKELNSRTKSRDIPLVLEQLNLTLDGDIEEGVPLDTVLASNMISVGIDIPRLGAMIVNGMPKTVAEYIQATSRVGRGIPGLVLTVYNASRPRDLSIFEHFCGFHQAYYRAVEATSVTPWSPRARDKALHAVFIGALRHAIEEWRPDQGAQQFRSGDDVVAEFSDYLLARAASVSALVNMEELKAELQVVCEWWDNRRRMAATAGPTPTDLYYWYKQLHPNTHKAAGPFLLRGAEDGVYDLSVRVAPNSMREVEPSVSYAQT